MAVIFFPSFVRGEILPCSIMSEGSIGKRKGSRIVVVVVVVSKENLLFNQELDYDNTVSVTCTFFRR